MRDDIYGLLKMLISTNTENPPGGEDRLVDKIIAWLKPLNPQYKKIHVDTGRSCLLLWLEGQRDEYIGFEGHLDTVPAGNRANWKHQPFAAERVGDTVYGRGAADMKGGIAAMLLIYRYYSERKEKPPCGILFMFTADEETDGKGMARLCEQNEVKNLKALIVCEPTGNTFGLGEMGTLWLKFSVKGIGCHASMSSLGVNALEEGVLLIERFKKEWEKQSLERSLFGKESCSLTKINGGVKVNMIPEKAEFYLDIRTVPGYEAGDLRHKKIIEAAKRVCAERMIEEARVSADVEVLTDRMPVGGEKDSDFIRGLMSASHKLCKKTECSGVRFFTDVSIALKTIHVPFLIFGPGDPKECHAADEKTDILQIEDAIEYYKIFINEIEQTRVI